MRQRAKVLHLPRAGGEERLARPQACAVVGGGIAGIAAATVLAERGARVTLFESDRFLGGRAGAWTEKLGDGSPFEMERGFHAFFRQYYNLRALLRRVDPKLSMLEPLDDYPILGPKGLVESFAGLPRHTPWNMIALARRTPTIGLRDLLRVNVGAGIEMVRYDLLDTYERFDDRSAREYLDSLRFPPEARRMLFDVFSHSFFNPEGDMSAGELLMMFHFYFVGNPEGLVFDVVKRPFSTALWLPFERHLVALGVELRTGCAVRSVEYAGPGRFQLAHDEGVLKANACVLATTVPGLQRIVEASPTLDDPAWRAQVGSLALTDPFAVWRLWLDRPVRENRAPFVGTTGVGRLNNISLYHLFEDEAGDWARRTGGAVVELHAYGVPADIVEAELRADLMDGLHCLYPETRGAGVIEERYLWRRDSPAFEAGSHALRPEVPTRFEGLSLAGDFVRLPIPSALMERAATAGMLAANEVLALDSVRPEPICSVPLRGMLARRRRERAEVHA